MKIWFLLYLISATSWAQINLNEESIESLIQSNPEVQNLRHRLEASQQLRGVLARSFMPKVEFSYGNENYSTGPYRRVTQPFGGVEVRANVFNSGKDALENDKRALEANVSEIDANLVKAHVIAEIRKAMAQLAYLEEVSEIFKAALDTNRNNMSAAQRRISAGLATDTDNLDFKQQNIMLSQDVASLEYEKNVVKRLLLTLFGHEPNQEVTISFANKHPEHGDEAKLKNPTNKSLLVKKAVLEANIADLELSSAKRWWAPSLDLYGYAMRFTQKEREYQESSDRNDVTIGFSITMPIFDGGEGFRVAKSKASVAQAQQTLTRARQLEIEKNSMDAVQKLELTHNLIHGAEESVEVMNKYRQGILSEYGRGVKNSPDVLQANQRWIETKNRFAEIKRNYQFAKADALYLISLYE